MLEKVCKTVKYDVDLSGFTTFGIGGRAKAVAFLSSEKELVDTLSFLKSKGEEYVVLGHGSNILVSDKGYDGTVLTTRLMRKYTVSDEYIVAECGLGLPALSKIALDNSLSGAEFLIGIPGSVGGGVTMNAGAFSRSLSDIVDTVRIFDGDAVREYDGAELGFGYRKSKVSELGVVSSVRFKLLSSNPLDVEDKMREFVQKREKTQPKGRSAGCVFKRADGVSAGFLADKAGLKGLRVGYAEVSPQHAGFIINRGGAKATDVVKLMLAVQDGVYHSFGIKLESEIGFLGEFNEDIRRLSYPYDI